jgi:hypothetical protein
VLEGHRPVGSAAGHVANLVEKGGREAGEGGKLVPPDDDPAVRFLPHALMDSRHPYELVTRSQLTWRRYGTCRM